MKHLKLLGLSAIFALGLIATVGPGAAQATTFCTATSCSTTYSAGTSIEATLESGSTLRITDESANTLSTCTSSVISLKTNQTTGSSISGNLGTLSWGNCSTTTDTVVNGSIEFTWASGSNATVVKRDTQVTIKIFGVSCTYGAGILGTHLGDLTGGSEPILELESEITKVSGSFLCPSHSGLDATYIVTAPHALFVAN